MAPDAVVPATACLKEVEVHFVVAYSRPDFALALRMLAVRSGGRVMGATATALLGFATWFVLLSIVLGL
jgi:hypothetical protein